MQYFKHMSNMRHDVKIRRLINKYGTEGYGVYNLILEAITEKLTTESPYPDLQETCEDMAEFYKGNTAKINEMVCFMVNQGLFEVDEVSERVTCHKLYKFLEANQTRSDKIRAMIKAYKTAHKSRILPSQTFTDISEEQNRTEQNRIEENTSFISASQIDHIPEKPQICKYLAYYYQVYNKYYGLTARPKKADYEHIKELKVSVSNNLERFQKIVNAFFEKEYWFNRDKNTKKPSHHLKSLLNNIGAVASDSKEPEEPVFQSEINYAKWRKKNGLDRL